VVCWGGNGSGQADPLPGVFVQVAAGEHHTCGVETDGTVTCWGANGDGQWAPVLIFPGQLPDGQSGHPYNQRFKGSGGAKPYRFLLADGRLPPGLALDARGRLRGTPTQPGTYEFAIGAVDARGLSAEQGYRVRISERR
jgi:hypothetical protein